MNALINVDVLGDIVSFLDITEDKHVLTVFKQICKISDNESNKILRTWKNSSKYECKVFDDRKEWYVNGRLHREADLPAIELVNGYKEWFVNGQRHREADKPAVECTGNRYWFVNGRLHREADKPAIEYADGTKHWYVNGKHHRDADKPAIEYVDGSKEWWMNDKFIRSSY